MKKYVWVPIAFFSVGCAFYIYYGVTWNAWMKNLPNMLIYLAIVCVLSWALKRKEQLKQHDWNEESNNIK